MGATVSSKRENPSETMKKHLLDEAEGLCPFCGDSLLPTKGIFVRRAFDIPHIYPLNPTLQQISHLDNRAVPGGDINGMANLIAACSKCHRDYDKNFNTVEFDKWVEAKRRLSCRRNVRQLFSKYCVEDEIQIVIQKLVSLNAEEDIIRFDYSALRINEKLSNSVPFILQKSIEDNVVDYFYLIQGIFKEIDKLQPYKFETLSSQIRTFYFKCLQSGESKDVIYKHLTDWLDSKTANTSPRACEIVLSFFIQNCEVY